MVRDREREQQGLPWLVIQYHYRSRHAFAHIQRAYESRVKALVAERGVARDRIKLTAQETRLLFDTPELEDLLINMILPLRDASHTMFRFSDIAEPYDSKISRIYHELSILKEEHLSVRDWPKDGGSREFARLFREVSEYYPQRLRRVRDLYQRATKRLEVLLPRFQDNRVVLRSVWLFREELWREQARPGLVRLLDHMFPEGGAPDGFLRIARSFYRAGFFEQAAECAKMGVAAAGRLAQARSSRGHEARDTISELDRLIAHANAEQHALMEQEA
jgi:hypothetical protein